MLIFNSSKGYGAVPQAIHWRFSSLLPGLRGLFGDDLAKGAPRAAGWLKRIYASWAYFHKANRKPGIKMNHMRTLFLIAIAGLIAASCIASAQTIQPETKGVAGQSTFVEKPSAVSSVKAWTRARWEAARKHWARDNAKFYACSDRWREQTSGRKYKLREQREFLFQCMNSTN